MTEHDPNPALETEWPYPVMVEEFEQSERFDIAPDAEQMQAIARRLGVTAVESLSANITLERQSMVIHVTGSFKAKVTQECVVTMDPVVSEIEDELEAWFADPEDAVSLVKARHEKLYHKSGGEVPMLDEKDDPEPIVDGIIDIGELAVQFLSLSINPYPHAEGVNYQYGDDDPDVQMAEARKNPFAALKDWKAKQEK